jgi:F-type H+/Na+-transporting ATPase subunit alpha
MSDREGILLGAELDRTFDTMTAVLAAHHSRLHLREVGEVRAVGHGTVRLSGLPGVRSEELVELAGGVAGMVFNLEVDEVGVIVLGDDHHLCSGQEAQRTGRVVDVPVGHGLLGRVVDPTGAPLDGAGPLHASLRRPVERDAPAIMDRTPVVVPLQTGIKVVDALIPIGRGQRELILGDRQTGKTAIALDAILNQADSGVLCVYCAVGQRSAAVAQLIATLRSNGAMEYTTVVVASGQGSPGLQFIAPYAATTIGEYFMEQGRDVLVVYDDLTRHAQAYRELSLLLRRPPGREAFPGDIFYVHSRLLERATRLRPELGGGSLTALPIIETEGQNLAAYIPTNLISITDGQIALSADLFRKGILPAVDVGRSVSRVGGKTQLPGYRTVAGDLRLSYAQFEELESFARFGTRLDDDTRETLERGRRVREALKQPQLATIPAAEQLVFLLALTAGLLDEVPVERMGDAEAVIRTAAREDASHLCRQIELGEAVTDERREQLLGLCRAALLAAGLRTDGYGDA